mmetsp:Transcript_51840/g.146878  ORF Transcript_51840/g.146878 Transcript_51840/m.146878 type:complete len:398 (+) Transcript_51840:273-1466(+)
MPEVHDEHEAVLVRVVPRRVREGGVEDDGLVLEPGPRLAADGDRAVRGYAQAEMRGQEDIPAVAVRHHAGVWNLAGDDDASLRQRSSRILQQLHSLGKPIRVPLDPGAHALQAEARPTRAHDIVLDAVGEEGFLVFFQKIRQLPLDIWQALFHLPDPIPALLRLPPRLCRQTREPLWIAILTLGQRWDRLLVLGVLHELVNPVQGISPEARDHLLNEPLIQQLPELLLPIGEFLERSSGGRRCRPGSPRSRAAQPRREASSQTQRKRCGRRADARRAPAVGGSPAERLREGLPGKRPQAPRRCLLRRISRRPRSRPRKGRCHRRRRGRCGRHCRRHRHRRCCSRSCSWHRRCRLRASQRPLRRRRRLLWRRPLRRPLSAGGPQVSLTWAPPCLLMTA